MHEAIGLSRVFREILLKWCWLEADHELGLSGLVEAQGARGRQTSSVSWLARKVHIIGGTGWLLRLFVGLFCITDLPGAIIQPWQRQ